MRKKRMVMGHRFDRLPMLIRVLPDLIACDDAALDFIEDDVAAKLDQHTTFVRNGADMRLKEAEHFLARGYLLALKHAGAGLAD